MSRGVPRKASTAYVLLVCTSLFWAGNWVIARAMQGHMSPVAMAFWRWAGAFLILLPFVARPIASEWRTIRRSWKLLTLLASIGVVGFNTLSYTGLKYTTATTGVLLNSVIPILIIAIAVVFLRERLTFAQAIGVFVSFTGVVAIVAHGELETLLSLSLNRGDLWVLAAMVCWAVYTICLRWRPPELSSRAFTGAVVAIGLALLLPVFLLDYGSGQRTSWSVATFSGVAYFAIFPSVLAYFFWNAAVARGGGERAGTFLHLMPVFGALLAWVFLAEALFWYHFAGAALIFAGIFMATHSPRPR
ncbi:MAG: DMT family transporter [Burkholderiales bacterium]